MLGPKNSALVTSPPPLSNTGIITFGMVIDLDFVKRCILFVAVIADF
jgi:hypothetical protein